MVARPIVSNSTRDRDTVSKWLFGVSRWIYRFFSCTAPEVLPLPRTKKSTLRLRSIYTIFSNNQARLPPHNHNRSRLPDRLSNISSEPAQIEQHRLCSTIADKWKHIHRRNPQPNLRWKLDQTRHSSNSPTPTAKDTVLWAGNMAFSQPPTAENVRKPSTLLHHKTPKSAAPSACQS